MTDALHPRVSIGLPVYNGENFLEEALRALLAQTYEDFELVISDNASTDRTAQICQDHQARDGRIRYYRQPRKLGLPENFNAVFHRARGEYFHWASHDDLWRPTFLERLVEALDRDPEAVLAYPRSVSIDGEGNHVKHWPSRPLLGAAQPHLRFRESLEPMEPFVIFGLIRARFLRRTSVYGSFFMSDFALLAELSLLGRFIEIPEELFLFRTAHSNRSTFVFGRQRPETTTPLWNPQRNKPFLLPYWYLLWREARAIYKAPLGPGQWLRCHLELLRHAGVRIRRGELGRDLGVASARIPLLGPLVAKGWESVRQQSWKRLVRRALADLEPFARQGEALILVDEAQMPPQEYSRWKVIPFIEQDGQYWGAPSGDAVAIAELERLRAQGARFLAIVWSSFWWLQHYSEWSQYIQSQFACLLKNDRVVVFDLQQAATSPASAGRS
jgi:glycosyltransferase involved in cell wall biosynthesis